MFAGPPGRRRGKGRRGALAPVRDGGEGPGVALRSTTTTTTTTTTTNNNQSNSNDGNNNNNNKHHNNHNTNMLFMS